MNKKAILFDMDGTLFDTEQISRIAWLETMAEFQLPKSEQFILDLIGRTHKDAQIVYDQYMPKGWPQEEAYAFHEACALRYKKEHGPLPKCDLPNLLATLKKKGYRLALVTSARKESVEFNLKEVDIAAYFDVIVVGSMVAHGKPAGDIYVETLRRLGLRGEECLVVEDSKNGVLAAVAAGIDVVMIPDMIPPNEELRRKCYAVIESLEQLFTIV